METFQKRQKEMRRLERRQDKAAKRQQAKARKAAGLPPEPDNETEETPASDSPATLSHTN